jgi:hypothetical protein
MIIGEELGTELGILTHLFFQTKVLFFFFIFLTLLAATS